MLKRITESIRVKENILKIFTNTLWLVSDRIIRMGVAMFVGIWMARYLEKVNFGLFNNAVAYTTIFATMASLGLDSILIRDLVRSKREDNIILGSAFYLKLIAGAITAILSIAGVVIFYSNYNDSYKALYYILSFFSIFQAFDVIDYYFQAKVKSKNVVITKNIVLLIINIFKVYCIINGADLIVFAWLWLIEYVLISLGLIITYTLHNKSILDWSWDKNFAISLLKESWPFYIAYFFSHFSMRIDQVMLSKMLKNSGDAGLFAAATKIYEIPFFIIMVLTPSIYPSLINIYDIDKPLFYKRYSQITQIFTYLGYLVLILVILLGNPLLNLLFSESYIGVYSILAIQISGMLFMFNSGLKSSYLNIISRQKIIMITSIIAAFTNVLLNLWLIPILGAKGAALSTSVTQLCSMLLVNGLFKETRNIFRIQLRSLFLLDTPKIFKAIKVK